jgi:hypothetical protein
MRSVRTDLALGVGFWVLAALGPPGEVFAEGHHHGMSHEGGSGNRGPGSVGIGGIGAVSGGYAYYGPPYWMTIGPNGLPVVFGPALPLPTFVPVPVPVPFARGVPLGGPMPPRQLRPPQVPVRRANANDRKVEKVKGQQLVTIGDRLFRAGNVKRAEERYEQAAKATPDDAAPRVRLAQVAMLRGQYAAAAEKFREAVDADPAWLARAPNIQSIFGEPRDFERQIAKLESHLLLEPADRDAWLVLGAELYLSGQTRRASDVFVRLTDRKPDPTLSAFLDAAAAGAKVK